MQAFRIMLHALRQVFGNFGQALLISALPLVMSFVAMAAAIVAWIWWTGGITADAKSGLMIVAWLSLAATIAWIAVRWHRFILLDERQGLLSLPRPLPFLLHAGIGLLVVLILTPPAFAWRAIVRLLGSVGGTFPAIMADLVLSVLFYGLAFILATALPGAAIGAPNPIRTAWRTLNPVGGTIILLAIIQLLVEALIDLVVFLAGLALYLALPGDPQFAATVLAVMPGHWLTWLIWASVLTTLWGHYVEGRTLR